MFVRATITLGIGPHYSEYIFYILYAFSPVWSRGTTLSIYLLVFCSFLLFPFLIHFTNFLLLFIPSLSIRIVPLHFEARGPNLDLVVAFILCYLYFLVKVNVSVLYLV